MNDRVSFTKDGQKITGKITNFIYDKHKNTILEVSDRYDRNIKYFILESELD